MLWTSWLSGFSHSRSSPLTSIFPELDGCFCCGDPLSGGTGTIFPVLGSSVGSFIVFGLDTFPPGKETGAVGFVVGAGAETGAVGAGALAGLDTGVDVLEAVDADGSGGLGFPLNTIFTRSSVVMSFLLFVEDNFTHAVVNRLVASVFFHPNFSNAIVASLNA